MTLFAGAGMSSQLMVIEEEDKNPIALSYQDFVKKLEDGKIKDGALITKVTVMEKFVVITKKELKKINGDAPKE